MAKVRMTTFKGINTRVQPFELRDGDLFRCVNLYTDQIGAKKKRPGYTSFLGTADGSQVQSMFHWESEDQSKRFLYRASGSSLYYYDYGVGTADWTLCGNGTISPGAHVGYAIMGDTLIIGDGVGSTRHTTNGTSFTDTVLAPVGEHFAQLFGRVYIGGTSSTLFFSTTNDATNWALSGTSDSSSIEIPGPGKINGAFFSNDRVVVNKTSGEMSRWDDFALERLPTTRGFSSPYSRVDVEGFHIGLNRLGFAGYGGGRPEILSSVVEKQIRNDDNTGIIGANFATAPAGVDRELYQCAIGTVTDDFTKQPVNDCVMVFNFATNEWHNYRYAHPPTAFHSFQGTAGNEEFIFGDAVGQVYKRSGTATADDGQAIESILEGYMSLGAPEQNKIWKQIWTFANPGCQAQIQIAAGNTFKKDHLNWVSVQGLQTGEANTRLGQKGRFLFYRLLDNSTTSKLNFYGFAADVDPIGE